MNFNILQTTILLNILSYAVFFFPVIAYSSQSNISKLKDGAIVFNKINSLQICHNKFCVSEQSALYDLYPKQNVAIIDNYGMPTDKELTHVVYSARLNDGKDIYGIFITQTNDVKPQQGLDTCNACPAKLGIVIYQFHNKWKLFAANPNVELTGKNGQIPLVDKSFAVYPMGTERFIITYDIYGQSQGYEVTTRNIILVNFDFFASHKTTGTVEVKFHGFFPVSESSCNAKEDGDYWRGIVTFESAEFLIPKIKMKKVTSSCLTKKPRKEEEFYVSKSGSEKRLVESRKAE